MLCRIAEANSKALRVGVPVKYSFYADLARHTLELIDQKAAGIDCRIIDTGVSSEPAVSLGQGCDIVLAYAPQAYDDSRIVSVEICERELALWVSRDNPLARRQNVSVRELGNLVYRPSSPDSEYLFRSHFARSIFHQYGISPTVGEAADALYQMGPSDFALIFGGIPTNDFGFRVQQVPLEESICVTVCACYRKDDGPSEAERFIALLRESAREMGDFGGSS